VTRVLSELELGTTLPHPQDEAQVTRAPRLRKEQACIDWSLPGAQIDRCLRAFQPRPGPHTWLVSPGSRPVRLIVLKVRPAMAIFEPGHAAGTVLCTDSGRLIIQAGDGALEIMLLQPEGKRVMSAAEYLRGARLKEGDRLGPLDVAGHMS
jgi:methionyl-tRNA formyltransferase